ncbi:MAG TPA: Uma2 family endonuclease [Thermoanaerobaculia bacterium]|nr:Uma2 family endonuclease [Thermoanaerobaculia bacterium]
MLHHPVKTTSASTKLTYDDYAAIPEDGRRHEIIDGEHYVTPAPFSKHQDISRNLLVALANYLAENRSGTVYHAPYDVVFSNSDVVQPDILCFTNEHRRIRTEKNIRGAPDLVIEIISESSRRTDEITKRNLYERFGVAEYWVVDPVVETVKVYRLTGGRYERAAELSNEAGGHLETPLLPGFVMDVAAVFREE